MHETPQDLAELQQLLDTSYEAAGDHLRSIVTHDRRMTAAAVCQELQGMCLVTLATVTTDGRPLTSPVDGIFYRGAFHFGTAAEAVRMKHITNRPSVSACYLPREALSITVHGEAVVLDLGAPENDAFRATCVEIYGEGWNDWAGTAPYTRIEAVRMFTFRLG